MEVIKLLADKASNISKSQINEDLIQNAFYFVLASLVCSSRIRFQSTNNKELKYPNFFGVTIAPSGEGKDLSLLVAEQMFQGVLDKFPSIANGNYEELNGPIPEEDLSSDIAVISPQSYKVPLQGSIQGLMRAGNFFNSTEFGSLNVVSTEFSYEFSASQMSILMTLWQSAKADGSINVNQMYPPITDVPTNVLLFGSSSAFTSEKHRELQSILKSGFSRRSTFSFTPLTKISSPESETDEERLKEIAEKIMYSIKELQSQDDYLTFSDEAKEILVAHTKELKDVYNEELTDWNKIKFASIDKTERLSALIAISEGFIEIQAKHVNKAIKISAKSFSFMSEILRTPAPYREIFSLMKTGKEYMGTEIRENINSKIGGNKDFKEQMGYLEEYAYRYDKRLVCKGEKLKKYSLKDYEENNLSKIIISIDTKNNEKTPERAIDFAPMEVSFFGERGSVESLIKSDVKSFCMSHFTPSARAENGHRKAENHIQGQNLIGFDIDDGLSIKEACELLEGYVYIIYTTKSHGIDKSGKGICDRFRILLPTLTTYYVTPELHKTMYENLAKVLEIPSYDVSTRNVSRLWFINKEAEIIKSETGELIDVRCCLSDTVKSEKILPNIEKLDSDLLGARLYGFNKYIILNQDSLGRNNAIYKLMKFAIDLGYGDIHGLLESTNSMFSEPLPWGEINEMLKKEGL